MHPSEFDFSVFTGMKAGWMPFLSIEMLQACTQTFESGSLSILVSKGTTLGELTLWSFPFLIELPLTRRLHTLLSSAPTDWKPLACR